MTIDELAQQITILSVVDQLALLERISRSVREKMMRVEAHSPNVGVTNGTTLDQIGQITGRVISPDSALHYLLGLAHTEMPLTDTQVQMLLADALLEKHS